MVRGCACCGAESEPSRVNVQIYNCSRQPFLWQPPLGVVGILQRAWRLALEKLTDDCAGGCIVRDPRAAISVGIPARGFCSRRIRKKSRSYSIRGHPSPLELLYWPAEHPARRPSVVAMCALTTVEPCGSAFPGTVRRRLRQKHNLDPETSGGMGRDVGSVKLPLGVAVVRVAPSRTRTAEPPSIVHSWMDTAMAHGP